MATSDEKDKAQEDPRLPKRWTEESRCLPPEMTFDDLIRQDSTINREQLNETPNRPTATPWIATGPSERSPYTRWIEAATQPEPSVGGRSYSKIHRIKSQSPHFIDIAENRKTSDVRRADRDYQPGDFLVLNEFNTTDYDFNGRYTGRHCFREITHVMKCVAYDLHGTEPTDMVILSIRPISTSTSIMEYLANNAEPEEIVLKRREHEERASSAAASLRGRIKALRQPEAAELGGHPPRLNPTAITTPHENELLLHLIQEASEVIKEATKVRFFGKQTENGPAAPFGYDNIEALSIEAGNLQHMLHVCEAAGLLREPNIKLGILRKQEGLDKHLTKR